jgi:fatty-acyl-CoA synthase
VTTVHLLAAFREAAERRPDAPAFTFVGGRPEPYSYGELFSIAADLAGRLARHELRDDAPLGLLLRRQEDQVLHYLAALEVGIVPAILTPPNPKLNRAYYAENMAGVLARSRFSAVVTDIDGLDLPTATLRPYDFEPIDLAGDEPTQSERLDAALLQFSSGTTGIKRGVLVTHEAALQQLHTYAEAIGLSDADVIVSWLPLYHDMGFIACLNMPLVYGVHTVMIDPIDWVTRPALFIRTASEHRATLAWNPNFAYAFMAQRVPARDLTSVDLSSLRGLVNCSEPVTSASQDAFLERFAPHGLRENVFWGCYAMAETTFALTHGTADDASCFDAIGPEAMTARVSRWVSVGRPLPQVELRVVSTDGDDLPDRQTGELYVRSPFTFTGYFNDPEATAAAFDDGWYRTGDVGYRVGDAYYVIERKKDVMIVGGVNVFPRDVEDIVSAVEGVIPGRVVAISEFDPNVQTERIFVLFESALEEAPALEELVLDLRRRILAALQIANFEVHAVPPGWLVKSSAGKISRNANRSKWLAADSPATTSSATADGPSGASQRLRGALGARRGVADREGA